MIWSRKSLPHTCFRLSALPQPLGGALVLAQNFIMHESQVRPPRYRLRICTEVIHCRSGICPFS